MAPRRAEQTNLIRQNGSTRACGSSLRRRGRCRRRARPSRRSQPSPWERNIWAAWDALQEEDKLPVMVCWRHLLAPLLRCLVKRVPHGTSSACRTMRRAWLHRKPHARLNWRMCRKLAMRPSRLCRSYQIAMWGYFSAPGRCCSPSERARWARRTSAQPLPPRKGLRSNSIQPRLSQKSFNVDLVR